MDILGKKTLLRRKKSDIPRQADLPAVDVSGKDEVNVMVLQDGTLEVVFRFVGQQDAKGGLTFEVRNP